MSKTNEYCLDQLIKRKFVSKFKKNYSCVIWKKRRKDSPLNALDEKRRSFKYVKKKIIEDNVSQRNRYRIPKHEAIGRLENVLDFVLET